MAQKTAEKAEETAVAEEVVVEETPEERLVKVENLLLDTWSELQEMAKRIDAVNTLLVQLAASKSPTKGAPKFGNHREAVKVLDTETDELYNSKSACGKAVAASMGLDAKDNFVYYQMVKQAPERFQEQTS